MRTITTTVYLYDELPTEEAKAKARQWWAECELQDPAWEGEHTDSMEAALEGLASLITNDSPLERRAMIDRYDNLRPTGYCADALFADLLRKIGADGDLPSARQVRDHYSDEWEKELHARINDEDYLAETIRANEYEFTAEGERA